MLLSVTLGFSPHLPVSVYGTDTNKIRLEVFLGSMITTSLRANALLITSQGNETPDLPGISPYLLKPALPIAGWSSLLRHSITQTLYWWYRNILPVFHRLRHSASA